MNVNEAPSHFGRWFEDFSVGDNFRHPLGRTITAADNAWFTLLTMNTNQLHFNDHYAAMSPAGRQLINSGLTLAIVLGLSVSDISQHAVANLSWKQIELLHPVFVDDTLYAESVITKLRRSRSNPHQGIVSCFTRGLNQDGITVLSYDRTVLVKCRTADSGEVFPNPQSPISDELGRAHR